MEKRDRGFSAGGLAIPPTFKICAYSVRREVGPVSSQPSTSTGSLLELWRSKVDFSEFFAWFVAVEDIENERRRDSPAYRDGHAHRGIVLIDEIDLHLHPKWQANVLPSLLRTFPELQFIVTTHSPIVLSHVDSDCVRLLDGFRLVDVPFTRGRDPNSVLTEVFGVPLRPAETQAQIDHIAELIGEELGATDLEVTRLCGLVELMEA